MTSNAGYRAGCGASAETCGAHRRDPLRTGADQWLRLWRRVHEFHAELAEQYERQWLLNHPWEEEFLHWTPDGQLHGRHLAPPSGRRRHGVTRTGWCLAHRSTRAS
ncbi:MAG: hypothetical protein WCA46_02505 [Actinocatenispora sp.]